MHKWMKANSVMLTNAGSLIGATAVTSVLGFMYWWVAARNFLPESVGFASAIISVMMLLGGFCTLGFGTLLITELPRQPHQEISLISTALIVVGGFGGIVGVLFAIVASFLAAGFQPLRSSSANVLVFALGVSLTAITLVLDQALIGVLRGGLQLWRNTFFAIVKLFLLFAVGFWLFSKTGIGIYATWAVGNALSLIFLAGIVVSKRKMPIGMYLPRWKLLRKLGFAALQHHLLNLTLQVPTQALPILVTALLSAKMNAWFYVSWMFANFVFIIPSALTTVLHAMNSAQPSTLAHKARVTLSLAVITSLSANCLLQFGTKQILELFGHTYADQAVWCLRILALAAFPLIIKNHYISICRIQDRIIRAMLSLIPGGLLELGGAALGAHLGGLSGLSLGWIVTVYIESLFMLPTVYKAVQFPETSPGVEQDQAIWLLDTIIQPMAGQSYAATEALWLLETIPLPAMKMLHKSMDTAFSRISDHKGETDKNKRKSCLKPLRLQKYTIYGHGEVPL